MRIISLAPSVTEILFAIGAEENIVATTYFCDYPIEAKKISKAGSFSHIDLDKIRSFNPDLILTSTIVQQRIQNDLKTKGFNVAHFDPRSLTDILDSISTIGKLVGKEKEARKVTDGMKKEIRELKKGKIGKKPRVYIEEWYAPPMYSGNWVPDLVSIAGGIYAFNDPGGVSRKTSEKELVEFDPQIIFVSYCGFGTKSDPNRVLSRPRWEGVTAVKDKQVFPLNETILNRPGPRILDAVKEIQIKLNSPIIQI